MTEAVGLWLTRHDGAAAQECCRRLLDGRSSVFHSVGGATTQATVGRILSALEADLTSEREGATRGVLADVIAELAPKGLGFHDLRRFVATIRETLLSAADAEPERGSEVRPRLEAHLFRLGLDAAMYFLAHRESVFQDQVTGIEVRQLEEQLSELQASYAEKAQLLELVKQVSTPIAPVFEGILVVPLVGVFDSTRAHSLTETLLESISEARAKVVILDISGVPVFDTATAQHLISTAKAAKLLGAQLILVGLSPRIAQTIAMLQVDLEGLITKATLQDGLALSLAYLRYRIVPISNG